MKRILLLLIALAAFALGYFTTAMVRAQSPTITGPATVVAGE